MDSNRICKGLCKKFRIKKPAGKGRYESGQGHCQMCDIWMDEKGCHIKNGDKATRSSEGWFCNCCNMRVRRKPRNIEYKEKLRSKDRNDSDDQINLSYFNKRRATMLKEMVQCLPRNRKDLLMKDLQHLIRGTKLSNAEIEMEFNMKMKQIIDLAYTLDPPNIVSMVAELEWVKSHTGKVPTKQEMEENSALSISQYEKTFQSWEHLLDRLGYDPWYRNQTKKTLEKPTKEDKLPTHESDVRVSQKNLEEIKIIIRDELKDDPAMLKLFNILDQELVNYDKENVEKIIKSL